jgi:hypothetical protein
LMLIILGLGLVENKHSVFVFSPYIFQWAILKRVLLVGLG